MAETMHNNSALPTDGRIQPDLQVFPGEAWSIEPSELTQKHVQQLGHWFYSIAFIEPDTTALFAQTDAAPIDELVAAPYRRPAMQYVDMFATRAGLPQRTLRRWLHQAAIDIAQRCLPILHAHVQTAPTPHYRNQRGQLDTAILLAELIAEQGLQASLAAQQRLVRCAVALQLAPDLPLREEPLPLRERAQEEADFSLFGAPDDVPDDVPELRQLSPETEAGYGI